MRPVFERVIIDDDLFSNEFVLDHSFLLSFSTHPLLGLPVHVTSQKSRKRLGQRSFGAKNENKERRSRRFIVKNRRPSLQNSVVNDNSSVLPSKGMAAPDTSLLDLPRDIICKIIPLAEDAHRIRSVRFFASQLFFAFTNSRYLHCGTNSRSRMSMNPNGLSNSIDLIVSGNQLTVKLALANENLAVFGKDKWVKVKSQSEVSSGRKIQVNVCVIQLLHVISAPQTLMRESYFNTYFSLFVLPILVISVPIIAISLICITWFSAFLSCNLLAFCIVVWPLFGFLLLFSVQFTCSLIIVLIFFSLCISVFLISFFGSLSGIGFDDLSHWVSLVSVPIIDCIVDTLLGIQTTQDHQKTCDRLRVLFKACSSIGTLRLQNMDRDTFNIIRSCIPSVQIWEIKVRKKKSIKTTMFDDSNYM